MSQNTFWHNEIRCSCSCYDNLFCCNVAAVVRSRQLHEYKSNKFNEDFYVGESKNGVQ